MKTLLSITSCLFLLCIHVPGLMAQDNPEKITDTFFSLYSENPEKAIDYAFSTNKWMMERNKDAIDNVRIKLLNLTQLIGDYRGYERIKEKAIGSHLLLQSYMMRYDRQPLRFTFIFYKPNETWVVQNFKFDVDLTDELEELGRMAPLPKN